jgi:hypothetical protein
MWWFCESAAHPLLACELFKILGNTRCDFR